MKKIKELKGQNGKLILYEDHIVISRKTFGGFMLQGGSCGDRRILLKDVTAIEYKTPTFFSNGYIKFIFSGTEETNAKVGIFASSLSSAKDQNTIIIRAFDKATSNAADQMYNLVFRQHEKCKSEKSSHSISKMDELAKMAKLRDAGILTEDEFIREKLKLLSSPPPLPFQ